MWAGVRRYFSVSFFFALLIFLKNALIEFIGEAKAKMAKWVMAYVDEKHAVCYLQK